MPRWLRVGILAVASTSLLAASGNTYAADPRPDVKTVLDAVAKYLSAYVPELTNIVAKEEYEQRYRGVRAGRRLVSDLLLVQYPGSERSWMPFRDVREADGKPIPNREERMLQLFISPSADTFQRALQLTIDSQRHHLLGGTFRITNPFSVLTGLQGINQQRLRFAVAQEDRKFGDNVWVLRFDEPSTSVFAPDVVRPPNDEAVFDPGGAEGRAWVDVDSGQVWRTEFRQREQSQSTNVTDFVLEPRLKILVPSEMRTTWRDPSSRTIVDGRARYSDYRRFEVSTTTNLQLPKP